MNIKNMVTKNARAALAYELAYEVDKNKFAFTLTDTVIDSNRAVEFNDLGDNGFDIVKVKVAKVEMIEGVYFVTKYDGTVLAVTEWEVTMGYYNKYGGGYCKGRTYKNKKFGDVKGVYLGFGYYVVNDNTIASMAADVDNEADSSYKYYLKSILNTVKNYNK